MTITEAPLVGADPAWDLTSIACFHEGTIEPFVTGDVAARRGDASPRGPDRHDPLRVHQCPAGIDHDHQARRSRSGPGVHVRDGTCRRGSVAADRWPVGDLRRPLARGLLGGRDRGARLDPHGPDMLERAGNLGDRRPTRRTGIADITLAAGDAVSCLYTNDAIEAELTIDKTISGLIDPALAWSFGFELSDTDGVVGTGNIAGVGTVRRRHTDVHRPGARHHLHRRRVGDATRLDHQLDDVHGHAPPIRSPTGSPPTARSRCLPGSTVACTFDNSPDPGELTIDKMISGPIDDPPRRGRSASSCPTPTPWSEPATSPAVGTVADDTLTFTDLVPGTTYTVDRDRARRLDRRRDGLHGHSGRARGVCR